MRTILLLFLLISLTMEVSDFICSPGVEPSLGVSLPRGDSFLRLGGPPLDLSCHLSPLSATKDSLSFQYNNSAALIPATTTISSPLSISTTFTPTSPGITEVDCILGTNKGVCKQRIFVGWEPKPVEKLTCLSDNWETLQCSWKEPYNPVPTRYTAHFVARGGVAHFKACLDRIATEAHLATILDPSLSMCYLDQTTSPPFRPTAPGGKYTLYINASNPLLSTGRLQKMSIDLYSVVKPGPAENLVISSSSPTSLNLSYTISKPMRNFPMGLRQAVRYTNTWAALDSWTEVDTSDLAFNLPAYTIPILDLDYPFTRYTVEVKMIPNTKGARYWSIPMTVNGTTLAILPSRPPSIHRAAFESIQSSLGDRRIRLYWKSVAEQDHCGPGFGYIVEGRGTNRPGERETRQNLSHSFATFDGLESEDEYTFSIFSENDLGSSSNHSSILVPPVTSLLPLLPQDVTKIYLRPSAYRMVWQPPSEWWKVKNYTVFWCLGSENDECSGPVNWIQHNLSSGLEMDLSLESDGQHRMGVAATSSEGVSSGLVWARCTVIQGRIEQARPRKLKVDSILHNSALLSWRLDCSEGVGLVDSYVVTVCPIEGECMVVRLGAQAVRKVSGLEPYTQYRFVVALGLQGGRQGPSSIAVVARTHPSAPATPPAGLAVTGVSSTSANLTWTEPVKPNGVISRYELKYGREGDMASVTRVETTATKLEVGPLLAYSRYMVTVRACTLGAVAQCWSQWSQPIRLRTEVGKPGQPLRPAIVFSDTSTAIVSWNRDFQLGAPSALRWEVLATPFKMNFTKEVSDDKPTFSLDGSSPNSGVEVDLAQFLTSDLDCSNVSSVHRYSFRLRAVVRDREGRNYTGPWSEGNTVQAYCDRQTPWITIVVGLTLVTVSVFLILICLGSSSRWYSKKKKLFSRIGKGLDSSVPTGPSMEMEVVEQTKEIQGDQAVLLTPRHKSLSSSSRDSGVSAGTTVEPLPPPRLERQESTNPSTVSGYLSMERSTSTPLSTLGPSITEGYCQLSPPYVAPSTLLPSSTPGTGYISIGAVGTKELVLQPRPSVSSPYSRVMEAPGNNPV